MANITIAKKGGSVGTAGGGRPRQTLQHTLDIAKINAALTAAGQATLVANDTVVLVDMPAPSDFHLRGVKNNTALNFGTGGGLSLGDAASPGRFVAADTVVSAGAFHTVALATFTYPTGGQVRFTLTGNAIVSGQITTFFEELDFTTLLPAPVL